MALFTKSEFARIAGTRKSEFKSFTQVMNEAKLSSRALTKPSVFISHAHTDKDIIAQTVTFLKGINVEIYVDWMDETMPQKPSGVTATKIKAKILENKNFVFLATNAAVISKWCNWEVGIGDAYKFSQDNFCLLPLAENNGAWLGNEYLQIYPMVEPHPSHDNIYKLKYPDGKEKWFDDWLKAD